MHGTLTDDESWSGTVEVVDDLLVPPGVTLTIRAGTTVRVRRADTSRTEPEFLDNGTEILVRGRLVAEGREGAPIIFGPSGPPVETGDPAWGGIFFDGGEGRLRHCRITGAEQGLVLLSSSPLLEYVHVSEVKHGLMIHGLSRPRVLRSSFEGEEGGIYCWAGSEPVLQGVTASGGEREGLLVAPGAAPSVSDSRFHGPLAGVLWGDGRRPPAGALEGSEVVFGAVSPPPRSGERSGTPPFDPLPEAAGDRRGKVLRGESYVPRDETWEGDILVDGTVMVAPGATLTIRPGTVVRFAFRDTNGDGIGESEIFIQGRLVARGEKDRPIVFTAEKAGGRGRWGAINIMGSDAEENVLSWCLIESSYRGLHSHFSTFRIEHSLLRNNHRAIQFQESRAVVSGSTIAGNGSGLRFRDSTVVIEDCRLEGNTTGLQALRTQLSLTGTRVSGSALAGVHLRETEGVVSGSEIAGNTPGLRASAGRFRLESNRITGNGYGGVLLRESGVLAEGNLIAGNAGNGLFTDSPSVTLRHNVFEGNLRFAVENNSPSPVDGALNFWGVGAGRTGEVIFDGADDDRIGPVDTDPPLESRPPAP